MWLCRPWFTTRTLREEKYFTVCFGSDDVGKLENVAKTFIRLAKIMSTVDHDRGKNVEDVGIEPTTSRMRNGRSATELIPHIVNFENWLKI